MIIPNLMVTDMARSLKFYRDKLGMQLAMAISPERDVLADTDGRDCGFAILSAVDGQLMLQSRESLRAEIASLPETPSFTGTVYMRGFDPRQVEARLDPSEIVKPMERTWYGMLELYVRDPDGYIICLGMADGPPMA